jgi:hypothetical protein
MRARRNETAAGLRPSGYSVRSRYVVTTRPVLVRVWCWPGPSIACASDVGMHQAGVDFRMKPAILQLTNPRPRLWRDALPPGDHPPVPSCFLPTIMAFCLWALYNFSEKETGGRFSAMARTSLWFPIGHTGKRLRPTKFPAR